MVNECVKLFIPVVQEEKFVPPLRLRGGGSELQCPVCQEIISPRGSVYHCIKFHCSSVPEAIHLLKDDLPNFNSKDRNKAIRVSLIYLLY